MTKSGVLGKNRSKRLVPKSALRNLFPSPLGEAGWGLFYFVLAVGSSSFFLPVLNVNGTFELAGDTRR